jgi:RNA polymerase sigma-70 factor (ECF subfamily)
VEEVVRRAQRGDAVALEAVVRELTPFVGRVCGAVALEAGDDAMQDAMISIVTHLGSLREPAALHGWARRIAVREAVRVARRGRSVPVDPADLALTPAFPDGATAVDVRAVLATLSPDQRAVLVLRHFDGLGEDEMAEVLGIAPGTVKSRLNRARAAFRVRWSA